MFDGDNRSLKILERIEWYWNIMNREMIHVEAARRAIASPAAPPTDKPQLTMCETDGHRRPAVDMWVETWHAARGS